MMTRTSTVLRWDPPGPGRWEPDAIHWPKPAARAAQAPFADGTGRGLASAFARHGLPLETLEMAFVNDVLFQHIVFCTGDELEQREGIAQEARANDQWRADAARWYDEVKPARLTSNLRLQDTDPFSVDDGELVEHLEELVVEVERAVAEHMDLVCVGDVVGRLLLAGERWGVSPAEMMDLLAGSSPGSAEAATSAARIALLLSGSAATTLDEARAHGADAAAAIDDHLRLHGWRMLDTYGPDGTTLAEQPDLMLRTIMASVERGATDVEAREASVRARVPVEDCDRFDELLADARDAYGVRDDNEGPTLLWPMGLLRRALLAASDRLGINAFVLEVDEIATVLANRGSLSAEIEERVRRREEATAAIPATIGEGEDDPPVIPEGILPSLAAAEAVWKAELVPGAAVGTGIGEVPYTGRACVCVDAAGALDDLQYGDVLITTTTTSAFNAVLSIAGALVVEVGGPACHSALVARELGLPAVIGLAEATARFRTGELVTVDPRTGTVRPA